MARHKQSKKTRRSDSYQRLTESYDNLKNFTDEALEARRKWFIQDVIRHYDMVEFGILYFNELEVDLESIYYDREEDRIMLHISCKEMEGDIYYSSLQEKKQKEVVDLMFEEMKHIEEGPTLLSTMVGQYNILYRRVYVEELDTEVMVTSEEIFADYINEGSAADKKFYCYVPSVEFMTLTDEEFEKYVNKNF